jgi:hypothetical protein
MGAAMVANLKEKTGRALPDWLKLVKKSGLAKHGEIVKHLKSEHAMGHGYANLVAHYALQAAAGGAPAGGDLVDAQYAGDKAALRPALEAILKAVKRFGNDVEIAPKKTCVSLRRNKQFALVQASTKTRLDVGLNLKGRKPEGRLETAGSFSGMCSHRVRVTAPGQVDAELIAWLRAAYEAS